MLHMATMLEAFQSPQDDLDTQILIVDDEPNIRLSLARALTLMGYSVNEASSGHEALVLLERTSHDLMVLDMHMPGLNGVEVMRRARQMQPDLLIIVLTGYATIENAIAAVKLDAVDYLRKPANTKEIVDAVKHTLKKRAKQLHQQKLVQVLGEALHALRQTNAPATLPAAPKTSPGPTEANLDIAQHHFLHIPPLILDCRKRLAMLEDDSAHPIELTKGETAVLSSLMRHPNRVLSCQELVHSSWGEYVEPDEADNIIRPHIFRLRQKLEADPRTPHLICTVRRRGYCFVPLQ